MDRQHPRNLFDVMELFGHGGITPDIRRAFVVSHVRPENLSRVRTNLADEGGPSRSAASRIEHSRSEAPG
jgi:hypothetical protein